MEVKIFRYANDYRNWLDFKEYPITIISVVVFDDELVVTYKRI